MKVLVAVDKGPESHMALAYACHLMEHFDAEIHAVYVKPQDLEIASDSFYAPFFSKDGLQEWLRDDLEHMQKSTEDTCRHCLAGRVPCTPLVVSGDPAEEILFSAREGDYDMIVMGSHGHSALRGFLVGAVHAKVLLHTRRPVLLVRDYREINSVLIVYRGSQCDQDAIRFVGPLLARKNPKITVLSINERDRPADPEIPQMDLTLIERTLAQYGHKPDIRMVNGDYVDETLKEVNRIPYDLLVLGAHAHEKGKLFRVISDEALNVVRSTTRPALIFRDKGET